MNNPSDPKCRSACLAFAMAIFVPEPGCGPIEIDPGDGPGPGPAPAKRRTYYIVKSTWPGSDCYDVPANGAVTRRVAWELAFMEEGMSKPMFTNDGVIWEHIAGLGSLDKSKDSPSSGAPGTYRDEHSIAGVGTTTQIGTQRFTAKLNSGIEVGLAIAAFGGTVSDPIGILNVQKYTGYVSINGDKGGTVDANGRLVPGSYTPCK